MKEWVLSVIATVLNVALLSLILPSGRTSKVIKSVLNIIVILVIIQPLLVLDVNNFTVNNLFDSEDFSYQYDYLEYVENVKIDSYGEEIVNILSDLGIKIEKSELYIITDGEADGFPTVKKIVINLENAVINTDTEHIDIIEAITDKLTKHFGLDPGAVEIHE